MSSENKSSDLKDRQINAWRRAANGMDAVASTCPEYEDEVERRQSQNLATTVERLFKEARALDEVADGEVCGQTKDSSNGEIAEHDRAIAYIEGFNEALYEVHAVLSMLEHSQPTPERENAMSWAKRDVRDLLGNMRAHEIMHLKGVTQAKRDKTLGLKRDKTKMYSEERKGYEAQQMMMRDNRRRKLS